MLELWQTRQKRYQKQLFKYLRYVLNDHFVLALLFILGGLALGYSNYLKSIAASETVAYAKPLVLVILVLGLQLGRIATLLKAADIVFLSPKQAELGVYLDRALRRSLFISWLFQTVIFLLLTPLLLVAAKMTPVQIIFLWLLVLVLKYLQLERQYLALYQLKFATLGWRGFLDGGFSALLIGAGLYLDSRYLLVVAALMASFVTKMRQELTASELFLWEVGIKAENERLLRLYRFFDLFTDVPYVRVAAKRRRYLDFILPRPKVAGSFTYLYWRALVRNGEISGLVLRLTFLGGLVIYFIATPALALVMALLFVYLLGFQLFALYHHYDEIVFMHLYPLNEQEKQRAFQKMLTQLLLVVALVFVVLNWVKLQNWLFSLELLGALVLEIGLLTHPYLKVRVSPTK